ncbi:sugar kinase [Lacrimispora sp. NSJ-141]|uniref:Sugar kinase n=1 Tax=Lientehia hominis TaxID=2897778 RepID=A0AAP2W9Z2_9FIRM|nr:sugar kinase [Lientehia hominis]MCD2492324.1 sugar kinase [Lientehia hominis]
MKVLAVGMMVCDIPLTPVPKSIFQMEKAEIEEPQVTTGGDALNVAVTLAKLGTEVSIAGRLGMDENGREVMRQAERHGVDTTYIIWDGGHKTAVSYLLLDEEGEKHALSNTRIYHALSAADVPERAVQEADIVYFGSAFQMRQMDDGGILELFQRAHRYGKVTAMDTALNDNMESRERLLEKLFPVFKETDIFLPSGKEASLLSGQRKPHKMAEFFKDMGVKICGIKLGDEGCYVTDICREFEIPCFSGFKAVDTTGAGDSFVGGFLCGYLQGWDIEECAIFASAVAAHNVAVKGATGGVPDFRTVMEYLGKQGLKIKK